MRRHLPNDDSRVAVARLRLLDSPTRRWVQATHGAAVDTGTAALADGADVDLLASEAAGDALEKALAESYVDTFSTALLALGSGAGSVCAFSSGSGDGVYAAWWGLDDEGMPVALYLDFDLLTESETEDAEFELPIGRGKVRHPMLSKRGVRARAPWLASNKLQVRYRPPNYVHARWKLPDGELGPIRGKFTSKDRVDFDLTAPPVGARLVLRVTVGTRRMRVE